MASKLFRKIYSLKDIGYTDFSGFSSPLYVTKQPRVVITLFRSRCDVMTSQRRRNDVVTKFCVYEDAGCLVSSTDIQVTVVISIYELHKFSSTYKVLCTTKGKGLLGCVDGSLFYVTSARVIYISLKTGAKCLVGL